LPETVDEQRSAGQTREFIVQGLVSERLGAVAKVIFPSLEFSGHMIESFLQNLQFATSGREKGARLQIAVPQLATDRGKRPDTAANRELSNRPSEPQIDGGDHDDDEKVQLKQLIARCCYGIFWHGYADVKFAFPYWRKTDQLSLHFDEPGRPYSCRKFACP
jgi:hypothetical protein